MEQLFPKEFINTSIEHYTFRLRKKSTSIYLVLVISVIILLVSLPFIKTEVTVSANGVISTRSEVFLFVLFSERSTFILVLIPV